MTQEGFVSACELLKKHQSPHPSQRDRTLANSLVQYCESLDRNKDKEKLSRALKVLDHCGLLWNDSALWTSAMLYCGAAHRISMIGVEGFVGGLQTFGFERLQNL